MLHAQDRATCHAVGALTATVWLLISLACPACAEDLKSGGDPWFRTHVFTGYIGCLAVQDGQNLRPGDSVYVFEKGKPVRTRRIAYLISSDRAERIYKERRFEGVYEDDALRDSIGCYWGLRSDPPRWIARVDEARNEELRLPIAIKGLPAGALTIGGDGKPLSPQELGLVSQRITASIPKKFQHGNILRAGWRYRSGPDHEMTEILLGRPFGAATPFDSIQVFTLFVYNGRVLATDRLSRVTGFEERVDTEAPVLDAKNWFEIQEEPMGFFSVDAGATWNRMSIDIGFEGILWSIRPLSDGSTELWDNYLYTSH